MADRCTQLVLEGLGRAAAAPAGLPLVGKQALFPANAAGKEAAQHCLAQGYLHLLRSETRGKTSQEIYGLTEPGLEYLVSQQGPRRVVADFIQVLQARQEQLNELVSAAEQARAELVGMRSTAEQVLEKLQQAPAVPSLPTRHQQAILAQLEAWQNAGTLGDCPLADLYEQANQAIPLTIGQFHDALRELIQQKQVYLHPWTGPLYALPQPKYALLVGHQVAYYASLRSSQVSVSA